MKTHFVTKSVSGTVVALAAVVLAATINIPHRVKAQDNGSSDEEQLVHIGYAIAPVPLNLEGKNPEQRRLVGLGSFIVTLRQTATAATPAAALQTSITQTTGIRTF